jgi:ATP-binding cassette subfamily C protein/ATP-binding cassette subfamily C protein LapB
MTAAALNFQDSLAEALRQGRFSGFKARSDWAACLLPLLSALGWEGGVREVAEALPHFADDLDLTDLRNTLAHLGYGSGMLRVDLETLDPRLAPCLFAPDQGPPLVLLRRDARGWRAFDGDGRALRTVAAHAGPGVAVLFEPDELRDEPGTGQGPGLPR